MSPLSWPVALGTLAVGSPALHAHLTGTLSFDVAMVRLLLCALGVWAVCSAVASLTDRATNADLSEMVSPDAPTRQEWSPEVTGQADFSDQS